MTPRNCGPHGVAWGGEGVVRKDRRSPYRSDLRSPDWLKVKHRQTVTVHVEACPHLQRTLAHIRELGARAGVALNPSTPPSALEYVLDDLDLVLVMSVNPGFGGQSFIPSAHRKVRELKTLVGARTIDISVDGGVKADLARSLAQDGASILVAGSAVFGAADPAAAVRAIRAAATA